MKKIIAISVMLALVAGAVFAETTLSGAVETRFSLAKQTSNWDEDLQPGVDRPKPVMGGSIGAAQIRLTGSNGDGTLGGLFNFRNVDTVRSAPWFHRVFVWWKPIEQVKIFLGIDNDGMFDTASIVGWSFHAGDNDYLFNHHWDFWRQVFPGNWDGFGLAFSFYPVQGLDLNLVLPTGGINWPQASNAQVTKEVPITNPDGDTYTGMLPGRLRLQGGYAFDPGKISFAYIGGVAVAEKGHAGGAGFGIDKDNNGLIGASFLLTAIDGIQVLLGGSAVLNTDSDVLINAGLGFVWNGDGFGVKVRGGLQTQGDVDMFITGNVMPFFAVGEKGQVLVDIGVTSQGDELGWSVTPAYRLGIEGGAFKIGLQVYSNVQFGGNVSIGHDVNNTRVTYDYIKWNIPMLLAFNF